MRVAAAGARGIDGRVAASAANGARIFKNWSVAARNRWYRPSTRRATAILKLPRVRVTALARGAAPIHGTRLAEETRLRPSPAASIF
jgi:hypothetical protein